MNKNTRVTLDRILFPLIKRTNHRSRYTARKTVLTREKISRLRVYDKNLARALSSGFYRQ